MLTHECVLDSGDLPTASLFKGALCHPSPHVQTATELPLELKDEGVEKALTDSANPTPPRALGLSSQLSGSPQQHAVTTKKLSVGESSANDASDLPSILSMVTSRPACRYTSLCTSQWHHQLDENRLPLTRIYSSPLPSSSREAKRSSLWNPIP